MLLPNQMVYNELYHTQNIRTIDILLSINLIRGYESSIFKYKIRFRIICSIPTWNTLCLKEAHQFFSLKTGGDPKLLYFCNWNQCTVDYLGKAFYYI